MSDQQEEKPENQRNSFCHQAHETVEKVFTFVASLFLRSLDSEASSFRDQSTSISHLQRITLNRDIITNSDQKMSESTTTFPWSTQKKPKQSKLKTYGRATNKTPLRETTNSIFTTHQQDDATERRGSVSPTIDETPHKKPKIEPFKAMNTLSAKQLPRFRTNDYPKPSTGRDNKSPVLQATLRHNSGFIHANMGIKTQNHEKVSTKQQILRGSRQTQKEIALARQRRFDAAIAENDRAEEEYQRKCLELYKHLWKAQIAHAPLQTVKARGTSGRTFSLSRQSQTTNIRAAQIRRDIKRFNERRIEEVSPGAILLVAGAMTNVVTSGGRFTVLLKA